MKKKKFENQIVIYQTKSGAIELRGDFGKETIWANRMQMAEMFGVNPQAISKHIHNIYKEKELERKATSSKMELVQNESGRSITRQIDVYNLDILIAVGYRINSVIGTKFRQWATKILRNYIHKGYALDSDRFKYGSRFDQRFFDDLLEEIRDIRSGERVAYQKITDIYATSIDYSPTAADAKAFFAVVQNRLHFAITGKTAAEIVNERASSSKPYMGLTTWRRAPKGKIMPSDVVIAKNYLGLKELDHLNRIVSMYLDYAELQAVRGKPMYMRDWAEKLNALLKFNEHEILNDAGKISHEVAVVLAMKEYEVYRKQQDKNYVSDFDREVKKIVQQLPKKKGKKGL